MQIQRRSVHVHIWVAQINENQRKIGSESHGEKGETSQGQMGKGKVQDGYWSQISTWQVEPPQTRLVCPSAFKSPTFTCTGGGEDYISFAN